MAKLVYLDFESTGTDPKIHVPHQLACIIEINNVEVERIDIRLRIPDNKLQFVEQKALDACRTTIEEIQDVGMDPFNAVYELCAILDKYWSEDCLYHVVEWSLDDFDSKFLRELLGASAMNKYFYSNPLNVCALAGEYLKDGRHLLPSFRLGDVAKYLGIETHEGRLHDGLYDALIMREIYYKVDRKR